MTASFIVKSILATDFTLYYRIVNWKYKFIRIISVLNYTGLGGNSISNLKSSLMLKLFFSLK